MTYEDATILDTAVVEEEVLSPKKFVELTASEKADIKSVKIVAPKLGQKGFGGVSVTYKKPQYRPVY